MKFRSIATRIVMSTIPIITISTILFIAVTYSVTYDQMDTQINEKMIEKLQTASRDIQLELAQNANVTRNMALYASTLNRVTSLSNSFEVFVDKSISSNKNTVGGGIWFEPFFLGASREYHSAYAYRENGDTIVVKNYHETVDFHKEGWYQDGLNANGEIVWSNVYFDPVANVDMITSSQSFDDETGRMQGVTTADMALDDIKQIVNQVSFGNTGTAFVVDSEGTYISHPDRIHPNNGSILNDTDQGLATLGKELMSHEVGTTQLVLNGVQESVYYNTLPDVGWKLVMLINTSEIRSNTMNQVLLLGILPILGLLITSYSIWRLVRHLMKVVNNVNRFADKAASGDLSERIDVQEHDEFGVMESRLNAMIKNMSEMSEHSVRMLKIAQNANKAKGEFLSRMSHEIRTPISAIIGMTHIALNSKDFPTMSQCLNKILGASNILLSLINDILDVAKIEANKLELYDEEFELKKTLGSIRDVIAVRVDEKSQDFTMEVAPDAPNFVIGDEMRLSQVLVNLVNNAVKFTPEHGKIELNVGVGEKTDDAIQLLFSVKDSGIGISDEKMKQLFRAFEQGDGGMARKYGGSGLGLTISKSIIELMGGKIAVESEVGVGSTFSFVISLKVSDGKSLNKEASESEDAIPDLSGKSILVVEDIDINREIVCALLEETKVQLDSAENGRKAVEKFRENSTKFDLIFMDVQMPEMDGLEATEIIRSMPEGKEIPIIALTANAFQSDIEKVIKAGMNGHVSKPIDPTQLYAQLRKYLANP